MITSRTSSLLLVFLLLFGLNLSAKNGKTIDPKNKYGGRTVRTDYQSGIRYTNEESLKYKTEYYDGNDVLRYTEALLQDGNLYRTFHDENGVILSKEWERPDKTIYSKEFYKNGKVDRIQWYNDDHTIESISYFDADSVMNVVERFPADSPKQIEHYRPDKSIEMIELFDKDSLKTENVYFDKREKEIKREYFKPDGDIHRITEFDEKGRLKLNEYCSRTGRKTIEYFEKNDICRKEVFDRNGMLDKVSFFNNNGDMIRAEIYDRDGHLATIRYYGTDKQKTKEESIKKNGAKTIEYFECGKPTSKEHYDPTGKLIKTEEY